MLLKGFSLLLKLKSVSLNGMIGQTAQIRVHHLDRTFYLLRSHTARFEDFKGILSCLLLAFAKQIAKLDYLVVVEGISVLLDLLMIDWLPFGIQNNHFVQNFVRDARLA